MHMLKSTTSASYLVIFTLPSTTKETISISTLQTFRSLVVMFHLRRPVAFLSHSYAIRQRLLLMWMFYSHQANFNKPLKQGYVLERLKSSFRKCHGRYGDLIKLYEVSLSRMLKNMFPSRFGTCLCSNWDFSNLSWFSRLFTSNIPQYFLDFA